MISSISDEFARNWNLYVIFCSAICTFFTLAIFIIVITAIIFAAKVVYDPLYSGESLKIKEVKFYEIGFKSSSLLASLTSIFFSLIVNGLAFFSLSFSSSTTDHSKHGENSNKSKNSVPRPFSDNGQKSETSLKNVGQCKSLFSSMLSSLSKLNSENVVSEDNFCLAQAPTLPCVPPPPAPPRHINASSISRQSVSRHKIKENSSE